MLIQRPARAWASLRPPVRDGRLFVLVRHSGQRIVVARSASAAARRPTQSSFVNIEHVFLSIDVITVERRPTNSGTIQSRAIRIPDLNTKVLVAPRAGAGDRAYRPRFASRRARSGGANTNRNDARAVAIFECRGLLDEEMRGCPYRVCLFTSFE